MEDRSLVASCGKCLWSARVRLAFVANGPLSGAVESTATQAVRQVRVCALSSLRNQLAGTVSTTALVGLFCGLVTAGVIGVEGVWVSLAAALVSLPVGVLVVLYFFRNGVSAESIVAGTFIRMFLTALLAGMAVLFLVNLRVPAFFLVLGVIYLANLGVETWFALRSKSLSGRVGASSRDA